jgi:hypothetical protein
MITHVLLAKLKDQSIQNIEATRALLASMNGKISSLRHLEVGKDIVRSERSYDVALVAKFDDLEGLNSYQIHPVHLPVSKRLRELATSIAVVDYSE